MELVPPLLEEPGPALLGSLHLAVLVPTPALVPDVVAPAVLGQAVEPAYVAQREDNHAEAAAVRSTECRLVVLSLSIGVFVVLPFDVKVVQAVVQSYLVVGHPAHFQPGCIYGLPVYFCGESGRECIPRVWYHLSLHTCFSKQPYSIANKRT